MYCCIEHGERAKTHRRKDYLFAFFLISPDYHLGCQLVRIAVSHVQSILVISKSKGPPETLRDIRTSTYQMCRIEENTSRT